MVVESPSVARRASPRLEGACGRGPLRHQGVGRL